MEIERFGLIPNMMKPDIGEITRLVMDMVPEGVETVALEDAEAILEGRPVEIVDSLSGCDAVAALGGDGTLLRAARIVEGEEIPVLGIKIRSLGFLTEDDPAGAVEDLFSGRCLVQERMRLRLLKEGEISAESDHTALNDIVLHGVGVSRVLHIRMSVGGVLLGEYLADGVIVSTPTGSTAYSLAAGGPILNPVTSDAMIITPLYPHSLSVRPIVLNGGESLEIELVEAGQETMLTIDGQEASSIGEGEKIRIGKSERPTRLLVRSDYSFYDLVRRKLQWGGVLRKR